MAALVPILSPSDRPSSSDHVVLVAGQSVVDLALVLAVDVSSSIDAGDYQMQMHGIADALRDPTVHDAIATGPNRRIALALVQWSTASEQVISLDWRAISSRADLEAAAQAIEKIERQSRPGGTGLAAAIYYCMTLFQTLPAITDRHVIDVSGDGADNDGGMPALARNNAVAQGITINGLPIHYGSPYLITYYQDQVIGGPGAFLEPTEDLRSFREAMRRKLLREIGAPVS